jgi:hypothetical protein
MSHLKHNIEHDISNTRGVARKARTGQMPWFFAGAQAITFATAVEQHANYCRATAVAFVNFFVMLGGFLLQPVFGAVLDVTSNSDSYTPADYRIALILLPLSLVLGTVLCKWLHETTTP